MSDRELLELAAKAAALPVLWGHFGSGQMWLLPDDILGGLRPWNPLKDDGDALRLAVKLRMSLEHRQIREGWFCSSSFWHGDEWIDIDAMHEDDPLAATRRVIVLAAAEIGRSMTS